MAQIDKDGLHHLTKLARLELLDSEEDKLLEDLRKILTHFDELNALDTNSVEPVSGGTSLRNVFRADKERIGTNQGQGKNAFPEKEGQLLVVPPVFE